MDFMLQAMAMLDATNDDLREAFRLAEFNAHHAPLGQDTVFEHWISVAEALVPEIVQEKWN
jgi:hypothetical protein